MPSTMAGRLITPLDKALHCAKCGTKAGFVEECTDTAFSAGEIILIQCPAHGCKEKPWFYCQSCKKRCYRNGLLQHAKRKKHIEQHAIAYPPLPPPPPDPPAAITDEALPTFPGDGPMDQGNDDTMDFITMDTEDFHKQMEEDLSATHLENATSSMDSGTQQSTTSNSEHFPVVPTQGNEWLVEALKQYPRATVQEMFAAFAKPEVQHMKNFWVAELGSGEGKCGGGVMYLAARAFQQSKDSQIDRNRIPDFEEAFWHFSCLIQYQSMNDAQRWRQSKIDKALLDNVRDNSFFKHTFLPPHHQLGRYYGSSGQHSMWNNLPCPKAVDIDGVGYVSPRAILTFLMANAIPIDDIRISSDDEIVHHDPITLVHHVCDSRKAVNWMNELRRGYFGIRVRGAPKLKNGAPKYPTVICLTLSDWTDGFGPGKVKNNRNAVDCKSFTISAPKHLVNATNNTFPVAMGLKNAGGWPTVERLFRKELEELTSSPEPTLFYNGAVQKIVPCFLRRFVVMSDKAERNGLSSTIACTSDNHRCFSVSGKLSSPICSVAKVEQFLTRRSQVTKAVPYGWSEPFVPRDTGNNGAVFVACLECRKVGLSKLGLDVLLDDDIATTPCQKCANWDLLPRSESPSLDFPAHQDYPTSITEGSPVAPPKGRDCFGEETKLPFLQLDWPVMKQACRFAFYQASRSGTGKAWTKPLTMCYLRYCGVSNKVSAELHHAAKACAKAKQQETVDYTDEEKIWNFYFPAAWLSSEITLRDYVEAVMHQLFLGIAESNYDLIADWLKQSPATAKVSLAGFQNILQALIKDLRPFQLSWLAAYPLTGKKGEMGTGSWVAENWVFLVRISQFIYGWCSKQNGASAYGVNDMSRMVIAYVALVARCLTHGGVNDEFVSQTELYMKEFMSAVHEFDVRVRHKVLDGKKRKTKSKDREGKAAEAYWLKPNYMSLPNLLVMMLLIGPLTLWWDGGGKGERFIQVVKPHIKHGIREDVLSFFVNLLNKLYQTMQLEQLEIRYGLSGSRSSSKNDSSQARVLDVLKEMAELLIPMNKGRTSTTEVNGDDNSQCNSNTSDEESTTSSDDDTEDQSDDEEDKDEQDANFSANQALGMAKKRTIYVYRNERHLNDAVGAVKPLAGIVEVKKQSSGETAFEFQMVFHKPVKQFARRQVTFDDTKGVHYHGLWCADIKVHENVQCTQSFTEIQSVAKLAAVAIPLWYVIGKGNPDSNKYCVITNWWKYRMSDGWYRLPALDSSLYANSYKDSRRSPKNQSEPEVNIRIVDGQEVGEV